MQNLLTVARYIGSALCFIIAGATLVNLVFIIQRPETISVVNAMIGQGVLIIGFFALGKMLLSHARSQPAETESQE